MHIQPTAIPDVLIIKPKVFGAVRWAFHGAVLVAMQHKNSNKDGSLQGVEEIS